MCVDRCSKLFCEIMLQCSEGECDVSCIYFGEDRLQQLFCVVIEECICDCRDELLDVIVDSYCDSSKLI